MKHQNLYRHIPHTKDLYEIGANTFSQGYHSYADEWFKASLAKYEMEVEKGGHIYLNFDRKTILKRATENKMEQEDFYEALRYATKLEDKGLELDIDVKIYYNVFTNSTSKMKVS